MLNAITLTDGYKIGHVSQLQEGTTFILENWTPRKSRIEGINEVVFFGQQAFIKRWLINKFNAEFFAVDEDIAVKSYYRRISNYLQNKDIKQDHIRALHQLGYLPLCIMSLPEGASSPIRVPQSVLFPTHDDFAWVPTYIETLYSTEMWKPCTSATIAKEYKRIFDHYAMLTVGNTDFTPFQGHDFSFRGMSGVYDAMASGAGHLLSFVGSDTIPAIDWLETYYNADCEKELIACSVPASEHAIMCSVTGFYVWDKHNGDWSHQGEAELDTFKRLITETYPNGIVSLVSDTWDLWKVLTEYIVELKDVILARDGKLVIRPDSGDPVDIVCGIPQFNKDNHYNWDDEKPATNKGVVELLWDVFGGTITENGYKLLDSHVGCIYGDSITMQRAKDICERLLAKGFASINWVAGIGSYTYQYQTRDTFGYAMKSTYCETAGYKIEIFKDPITDDGTKKSARGIVAVHKDENGKYYLKDQTTFEDLMNCELKVVFKDGKLLKDFTLQEVRDNMKFSTTKLIESKTEKHEVV